ncbi:hypothetical protein MFUL124B02_08395 [Myxococcus fulvus 124B02]|nr:hypothetical protein MFUL124B02_08395 [Myxococcus fulvus 124B02]
MAARIPLRIKIASKILLQLLAENAVAIAVCERFDFTELP